MKKLICFFKGHNYGLVQAVRVSVYKRDKPSGIDGIQTECSGYKINQCRRCGKRTLHIEGKD